MDRRNLLSKKAYASDFILFKIIMEHGMCKEDIKSVIYQNGDYIQGEDGDNPYKSGEKEIVEGVVTGRTPENDYRVVDTPNSGEEGLKHRTILNNPFAKTKEMPEKKKGLLNPVVEGYKYHQE